MSKYLSRLKAESGQSCEEKNTEKHQVSILTKPTKPTFVSNVSTESRHISGNDGSDLHRMVSKAMSEFDQLGRPWPLDFLATLPSRERHLLRELENEIDNSVLTGDVEKLSESLAQWRAQLLKHLH